MLMVPPSVAHSLMPDVAPQPRDTPNFAGLQFRLIVLRVELREVEA